jgi:hypothetical protein
MPSKPEVVTVVSSSEALRLKSPEVSEIEENGEGRKNLKEGKRRPRSPIRPSP